MAKKTHLYENNSKKHTVEKNTTEGGSCLTGHDGGNFSKFGRKTSCNYRYQAYEQAKSNDEIRAYLHSYNDVLHLIQDQHSDDGNIKTSAYKSSKGTKKNPAHYCAQIRVPKKGDWNIGGPNRNIKRSRFDGSKVRIPKSYNFTQDTWPYWNNAHHLIPKGTLKTLIMNEEPEVGQLMEVGLLDVGYNINHKRNMLLLPQDKEVGAILDMPRHIQLKEGDDNAIKASCTNHPVYNKMTEEMEGGLEKIIKGYRDCIETATQEDCVQPNFTLDKTKLEKLSDKLLRIILAGDGGRSLDSLANLR